MVADGARLVAVVPDGPTDPGVACQARRAGGGARGGGVAHAAALHPKARPTLDSAPAWERSFSNRVTSSCKARAFFAVRRTCFVSSSAAFSLPRHLSSCRFSGPARERASTSAWRSSSQRASAASVRARSRSYSDRRSPCQPRREAAAGNQLSPSAGLSSEPAPPSRTSMPSTIAHWRSSLPLPRTPATGEKIPRPPNAYMRAPTDTTDPCRRMYAGGRGD